MYNTVKVKQMPDLGKAFSTLMEHVYIRYNGCLIEKHGSTYVWAKKCYPSLDAAKKAVDNAATTLSNSILNRA